MITYVNTNPGDSIALHDVLRVTFAAQPSWLIPDIIESQNLAYDISNLIDKMSGGGFPVAAVSDVTVAPGARAVTIDFMPPGQGTVTVARVVQALTEGLYAPLEFIHNTIIERVERIRAAQAGAPGAGIERGEASETIEQQLQRTELGAQLATLFGSAVKGAAIVGGVVLLLLFAPEIKGLLRSSRREHGTAD